MTAQWFSAGIGLMQLAALALIWRMQRDHARLLNELKEWVHREYMPRELADARYLHKQDSTGIPAVSQPIRANS